MHTADTRVRVVVIAYQAETTIIETLDRIPTTLHGRPTDIVVSDDASTDATTELATAWAAAPGRPSTTVIRRPNNLGYGGNQITCFREAIEDGIDAVAVVHGDAQYPPEYLEGLIAPITHDQADAVFGSRFLVRGGALRGRMPLDRYVGNRLLSTAQNLISGARLSEWHSGFRAYRTSTLTDIAVATLTTGFDFDTAIILRLLDVNARIVEIPIPTRYEDEVSYIDPYRTGWSILRQTAARRAGRPSSRWRSADVPRPPRR